MTGILAALVGAGLGPISLSAGWGNMSTSTSTTNANVTLTYAGADRTIKVTHVLTGSAANLKYRVNSGTYTNCPTGTTFTVPSGQTLNFQLNSSGDGLGPETVSVKDTARGDEVIGTFTCTNL